MNVFGKIGLFFVITFVLAILLAVVQQFLGVDLTQISLPQFGPGIAALVMLGAFGEELGWRGYGQNLLERE